MKAIVSMRYGSPDVLRLEEIDRPEPKERDVLVEVRAASVTAADGMIRQGTPLYGRPFIGLTRPRHPVSGAGFAGIVAAIGEGVTRFAPGDRVFGESTETFGTHAEYVRVAEETLLLPLPAEASFEEAATFCDGPLTALCFLRDVAELRPGQRILVNGASGSIGTAAVQLAKHLEAEVTGVCSGANLALVSSLGADEVIDYTREDFTASGRTWDVVFDTIGKSSFGRCRNVLTPRGTYMSPVLGLALLWQMLRTSPGGGRKAKFSAVGLRPAAELRPRLEQIVTLVREGELRTVIERRYPLSEAVEAHRHVATGHKRGSVVIVPDAVGASSPDARTTRSGEAVGAQPDAYVQSQRRTSRL